MTRICMNMNEIKEVWEDYSRWLSVVTVYPMGGRRELMNVIRKHKRKVLLRSNLTTADNRIWGKRNGANLI